MSDGEQAEPSVWDLERWKLATVLLLAVGQIPAGLQSTADLYYVAGYFVGGLVMLYLWAVGFTYFFAKTGLWLQDSTLFPYSSIVTALLCVPVGLLGYAPAGLYVFLVPLVYVGLVIGDVVSAPVRTRLRKSVS